MAVRVDVVASSAPTRFDLNRAHVAFATAVFFCTFGGQALRAGIGFVGWVILIVLALAVSIVWLVRAGAIRVWRYYPLPLLAFAAYAVLSTAWSQWRPETALGATILLVTILVGTPLAVLMSWEEIVVALSGAIRWIVALSFVFELVVSLIIRHPILPVFLSGMDPQTAPVQYLWSRDLLLAFGDPNAGKLQGIVGNSTVLGEVAAYGLIALFVQFMSKLIGRFWFVFWAVVLLGTLVLTRSATMAIALAVTAVVLVVILLRRRVSRPGSVVRYWLAVLAGAIVVAAIVATQWGRILALFGKSEDLTGRAVIWGKVIGLAVQHPAFGWGWLGYWPPWVEPLGHLYERYGTYLLQAHDAWLDLWMQVGIVGLVLFALIAVQTVRRAYRASIERMPDAVTGRREVTAVSLLPILLLTALLVQSITESRLLVEDGLITFVILSIGLAARPFRRDPDAPRALFRR